MFFSARRVIGEVFRQVQRAAEQHLKAGRRVTEMNTHHTVVDFAAIAVVLPAHAHRMLAALGRARLVDATDRLGMSVLLGDDLLAAVVEFLFIPLDRFEKAL
jgi:hypothetical protein